MVKDKKSSWVVHKFGGTSVGSVAAFQQVVKILEGQKNNQKNQERPHRKSDCENECEINTDGSSRHPRLAVVVSAMSGVTDRLIKTAQAAAEQNNFYLGELQALLEKHQQTAESLLGKGEALNTYVTQLQTDIKDLQEVLRGVWLSHHLPESTLEMVSGYGELWSSRLLAAAWKPSAWLDARQILVVENGETGPLLQWEICQQKLLNKVEELPSTHYVITGFIASTSKGVPTTLKRNGSDFSASIFGRLFDAKEIVIWTDVDGVYSADPRKVPEAQCLSEISYEEAIELAYFGAKVIHPHTMGPAVALNIPILIKNTFRSEQPGTFIHRVEKHRDGRIARGFTTVDQVSLINVEGTGMIGVPGVSQRLFGALREVGVSVMLISQASSEHSICFVVPSAQSHLAKESAEKVFHSEMSHGLIERVEIIPHCSIIAMVGDNMVEKSGVAGRFFSALGNAGVSVRAIAQGSSERNISAVISQSDSVRALRATHSAFFLSHYTISIGLIGPGLIGKALLKQIQEQQNLLRSKFKVDLRIRGLAASSRMILEERGIHFYNDDITNENVTSILNSSGKKVDWDEFGQHIQSDGIPHSVIIDCTSSEAVADQYATWLQRGIHIITPNKKAGAGPIERLSKIHLSQDYKGAHFFYEATVGAGLPIITTLRDLIQTGDSILSIEGVVSGTLAYLFSEFKGDMKFSEIILKAKQNGFTEPDPRDDLNGMDVARKIVILAREAGFPLKLSEVAVESLVPEALAEGLSTPDFLSRLSELDEPMKARRHQAEQKGNVLKYTASLSSHGEARVGLSEYPSDHPFARISGSDNIILFRTKRYHQQPLVVQGPGAGPEVTAGGIFADLLRLVRALGAPL